MSTKISPVGSSASSGGSGGGTIGGLVTGGTQGSVLFVGAGGVLAQDNTRFFYDDTNNQLQLSVGAVGNTPLKITLFAAQTADALQVYASDGTTKLANITAAGVVTGTSFVGTGAATNVFQVFSGYFMGVGSGTLYFRTGGDYQFTDSGGVDIFRIFSAGGFLSKTATPASASATGVTGTMAWDTSYIYVCTATNTWKRTALTSW